MVRDVDQFVVPVASCKCRPCGECGGVTEAERRVFRPARGRVVIAVVGAEEFDRLSRVDVLDPLGIRGLEKGAIFVDRVVVGRSVVRELDGDRCRSDLPVARGSRRHLRRGVEPDHHLCVEVVEGRTASGPDAEGRCSRPVPRRRVERVHPAIKGRGVPGNGQGVTGTVCLEDAGAAEDGGRDQEAGGAKHMG